MTRHPDKHPLDSIIRIFGSRMCIAAFVFIAFCLGCFLSIVLKDWSWLTRFGSLISIAGLLATSSPLFIKGIYKSQSGAGRLGSLFDDGTVITTNSEERAIGNTMIFGIIIAIFGGLISAFGDLIGNAIDPTIRALICLG